MRKRKLYQVLSMALTVALVTTMVPAGGLKVAKAADAANYVATPVGEQTIITGNPGEERQWAIDWSDEFNGDQLDTSKWSYMVGTGAEYSGDGWGNSELEYYTNGDNAVVSGGALTITAKKIPDSEKANYANKSYTSTRLWTMDDSAKAGGPKTAKYTKQYGRIEARIQITSDDPDGTPTGLWPAFWMMPAYDKYGTWASSGEIDIMETRGSNTGIVDGTIHFGNQWPNNKSSGGNYKPTNPDISYDPTFTTADYHTYAVEWLPGEIRWYMDDQLYYTAKNWFSTSANNAVDYTFPAPFNQDFYVLLNLAVGGNYDGGALSTDWNKAEMNVDYVRAYDLVDSNGDVVDYNAMEDQVVKPVDGADPNLVSGEIGVTNYVGSPLSNIAPTTSYSTEAAKEWFLSTMLDGAATTSMVDPETLKVDVTAPGTQNYSVQLIHNVPLTKGYRYVLTFDGKADASRSISAKYGNNVGYPAYSDSYPIDLTSEWKSYTYTFDMKNTTDATGRIEFNLGLGTGASYFKNFKVVCTGLTPVAGQDDAKTPLANGNHIYNGTFDQGIGRSYFWHAGTDTSIAVQKAASQLEVTGTTVDSNVYQKGMNLLKNDTYHVTFDAKTLTPGNVTVRLLSKDMNTVYGEKTLVLNAGDQMQALSCDITMPDVTDTEGVFQIITGANTLAIDNVTMKRTSNNNMDWSGVDFWPLYNNDFFNGADGWNIWSEKAGYQSHSVTNGVLNMVTTIGANPDFWCVGVQSPSMQLSAGVPYKFTVHLNGSKAKTVKIETPDKVQKDYNFVAGDNTVVIDLQPSQNLKGNFSMYFGIGEGAYDFSIDSVDVEIDTAKLAVPEGYAKPGSVTSAGNVRAGQNVVIKHNNDAWASKITKTYVNGAEIDPALVVVNADSTITIASAAMPAEGNYSVKFDATGYTQTKAIAQTILEATGNVILNGTFDANLDGWTTWNANWNHTTATFEAIGGKAVIGIVGTEGNNWDAQFKQAGINVDTKDYYILQFDAAASVARPLQMEFAGLGTPSLTKVNLTTGVKTYYVTFSNVTASNAASILFLAGNVDGCLADFAAVGNHTITLDNVKLYVATKEQVEALQEPTLSFKDSTVVGNDAVLYYSENTTWENKTMSVKVDGVDVSSSATVDKNANTITIAKAAFATAKSYTIEVTAQDYKAVTIPLRILSKKDENLFLGNWITWVGDGDQGKITTTGDNSMIVDFVASVNSQWNTPEFWSMQAKKTGIATYAGKEYKLTFDAELSYKDPAVTANRDMVLEWAAPVGQKTVTLKPGKSSYEVVITPGENPNNYLMFMPGGKVMGVAAHTLNITNIKFAEVVPAPPVTPLTAPAHVVAAQSGTTANVDLTWDVAVNATGYKVYRGLSADGLFDEIASTTLPSYKDTNLVDGKTYYYKVKALGTGLYSDSTYSEAASVTVKIPVPPVVTPPVIIPPVDRPVVTPPVVTPPVVTPPVVTPPVEQKPVADTIEQVSNVGTNPTGLSISFNEVKDAEGYLISIYKGKKLVKVVDASSTDVEVENLAKGTKYTVVISPYNVDENGRTYVAPTRFETVTSPDKVILAAVTKTESTATLSWKKVTGASGYEIFMKNEKGEYVKVKTVTGNNRCVTISGLENAEDSTYKVCAYVMVGKQKVYGALSKAK